MGKAPLIRWVRTDRLGDLLCSLPSLLRLRQADAHWEIEACIPPVLEPVVAPLFREWNIRAGGGDRRPDAVLFLNYDFSRMRTAWVQRIPCRVGQWSKPASFVFLNRGLRQRRFLGDRHEGEYCEELADHLLTRLGVPVPETPPPSVELPRCEKAAKRAKEHLDALGLSPKNFWVLHPGMGGSALNLSTDSYVALARRMALKTPVVLSEGPLDSAAVARIREKVELPVLRGLLLDELREVFRMASGVVGPSTGPLHLAHLVGTPVVGLYSPVRCQSPIRWAPRGGKGPSRVFAPAVACPVRRGCLRDRCEFHPCMDREPWGDWFVSVEGLWRKEGGVHG